MCTYNLLQVLFSYSTVESFLYSVNLLQYKMTALCAPNKFRLASNLRHVISRYLIKEVKYISIHGRRFTQSCRPQSARIPGIETTIFMQEGHVIDEVPVAVLTNSHGLITNNGYVKSYKELDPVEEAAFVEGFNNYHTPKEVLKILDTIPSQEVTPFVAYNVLKKLFELESNFGFRNDGKSWVVSVENGKHETFARAAIIGRLVDTIISSDSASILLDTLDVLRSEKNQVSYSESEEFLNYRSRLCDDILVRVTEGQLYLAETCRVVCSLGEMEKHKYFKIEKKFIDKLCVGILDKRNEITVSNIVDVFRTVQYFTKSQRLVLNVVEKNLMTLWWRMDADAAAKICELIGSGNQRKTWGWCISGQLLKALSRCTSLNMHQVTEAQLLQILKCFRHQNFCDQSIQKALSKYMKAKFSKISNPELVAAVADYAKYFRLRDIHILEAMSEFVVLHEGSDLSPPQISAIVTCFGHLNFQPPNGIKFWEAVEKILDDKFVQFTPRDILDIFLACVYLAKYPLNFVGRIFSPYFLDRINSSETAHGDLQSVRCRLKLLDASLNLECNWKYGGPLLPKDFSAKSLFSDGRVIRTVNAIKDPILELCGKHCSVESSAVLPSMPLHELYMVDILVIPIKGSDSQLYNYLRNRVSLARESLQHNSLDIMCFLINIPEHFSADGNSLIGPQTMRIRHLKALGFKVVSLKYEILAQLRGQALSDLLRQHLINLNCPGW